ncbi:MAG: hypothetical protein N2484_01370 [Clostridia bacterium]|nr:hypothetical protein [Clostridia bacterium]
MNYREIENLKTVITQLAKKGCRLTSNDYGVNGRIVGIGFKPCWTNPVDSRIERLEFNCQDGSGSIIPFYLYNIIGFDIVSLDGEELDNSKKITLDMYVLSTERIKEMEGFERVRINLAEN